MDDVVARTRIRPDTGTWEVVIPRPGRSPLRRGCGAGEDGRARAEAIAAAVNEQGARSAAFSALRPGDALPVANVLRDWIATYRETLAHSYEQTARGLIENHLAPYFGSRDLRSLRERDALDFASHVVGEKKLSPSVARGALSILRRVSTLLVRDGVLERHHLAHVGAIVARIERRHSTGVRQRDAWTAEELRRLIALAREREPWLYPVIVFCAYTGARRGEALGLRWDAVNLERGVVVIREARVRGRAKAPKSGRQRIVELDLGGDLLLEVLRELAEKRRSREPWAAPELVFRSPGGHPIDERNFSRAWDRLRAHFPEHAIRPLVFHSLRHTFATLSLVAGATVREVGEWLGHSSERVTELYAHVIPKRAPRGFLEQRAPLRAVDGER